MRAMAPRPGAATVVSTSTPRPRRESPAVGDEEGIPVMTPLRARDGALYPLRAVDRVCDVIDALAAHPDGITLSVLSLLVNLPKSSTFRYLAALETRGIVTRTDDDISYRLAPGTIGSNRSNAERLDRLLQVAKPLMQRIASSGSVISLLATLDGAGIRFLWVDGSASADRRTPVVGEREHLHTTAVGKAIAGQLSDEAVLAALETAGMATPTPQSLSAPTALLRELHRVRGEGFALSAHERYPDVRAVAVPIGGETMALGLAGLAEVLTAERVSTAVRQLRRAAVVLARELRD